MKHENHSKRLLSVILSLALMTSGVVLPYSAAAAADVSDGYSTNRADISFEYMGTSESSTPIADLEGLPSGDISDFEWTADDYVWVGVYFENMERIQDLFGSEGLTNLTLSMFYNSDYLEWNTSNATDAFAFIDGSYANGNGAPIDPTVTYPYKNSGRRTTPIYQTTGFEL